MANESQFKTSTSFVATRGVKEYRATIAHCVKPDDRVLEVGCEFGTTSICLLPKCETLVSTDISRECINRARNRYPNIHFEVLDVYDLPGALKLGIFSVVYMDVSGLSGYRSLLDVIALLQMYATMMSPRTIVVKSGALKHFLSRGVVWRDDIGGLTR